MPLSPSLAKDKVGDSMADNFRLGASILLDAVEATGGRQDLTALDAVSVRLVGGLSNATQYASPAVMSELHPEDVTVTIALDFAEKKFRQEIDQKVRGGLGVHSIFSFSNNELAIIWPNDKTYSQFPATPDAIITSATSFLPPLLLKEALKSPGSISWEGKGKIEGDDTDIVGFSWKGQKRYFLHISRSTKLVRALEYIQPEALTGDDNAIFVYSGSQTVGGVVFPRRLKQKRWGYPYADVKLSDLKTNAEISNQDYSAPAEFEKITPPIPTWTEIADGVFEVRNLFVGNYRSIIVELDNSIVVFDAPVNAQVTGQVRKLIADNLGDKPVSHLILSHYHLDHVGGLGVYAKEGAVIVTAPGNQEYFTKIAQAKARSADLFSVPIVTDIPSFQVVQSGDTFAIQDGEREVEITNIGPIAHVDGMLVAYAPIGGIAINSDLYGDGVAHNSSYESFKKWLAEKHNDAKLILGVHHNPITAEKVFE